MIDPSVLSPLDLEVLGALREHGPASVPMLRSLTGFASLPLRAALGHLLGAGEAELVYPGPQPGTESVWDARILRNSLQVDPSARR